jgi:hypothetical protein
LNPWAKSNNAIIQLFYHERAHLHGAASLGEASPFLCRRCAVSESFPAGGYQDFRHSIKVLQGTPRPTTLVPVKDLGSPHVVQHPLQLCVCAQVEEH